MNEYKLGTFTCPTCRIVARARVFSNPATDVARPSIADELRERDIPKADALEARTLIRCPLCGYRSGGDRILWGLSALLGIGLAFGVAASVWLFVGGVVGTVSVIVAALMASWIAKTYSHQLRHSDAYVRDFEITGTAPQLPRAIVEKSRARSRPSPETAAAADASSPARTHTHTTATSPPRTAAR